MFVLVVVITIVACLILIVVVSRYSCLFVTIRTIIIIILIIIALVVIIVIVVVVEGDYPWNVVRNPRGLPRGVERVSNWTELTPILERAANSKDRRATAAATAAAMAANSTSTTATTATTTTTAAATAASATTTATVTSSAAAVSGSGVGVGRVGGAIVDRASGPDVIHVSASIPVMNYVRRARQLMSGGAFAAGGVGGIGRGHSYCIRCATDFGAR